MKTVLYYCLTLLLCISVCNSAEAKKKKYPNGDVYEGEWKKGQPEGIGKMIYANGNVYLGGWSNGKRQGKGKMTRSDKAIYEGEWKNGYPDGIGKMTYPNGGIYEGEWSNNKRQGKGKSIYPNGDIYEGEWKNSYPDGIGIVKFANGNFYDGQWKEGKRNGIGKMIYANGEVYEGEWKSGQLEGKGKMTYANGEIYEGEWRKGEKFGQGKMIYANGDIYEGGWKEGQVIGGGKITYANGEVYDCCGCKDGKFILITHPSVNNIATFIGVKNENGTMTGKVTYPCSGVIGTYIGNLMEYKRHGEGFFYFDSYSPDFCISGIWKHDSLISGSGKFVVAGDTVYISKIADRPFRISIETSNNNTIADIHKVVSINQLYSVVDSEIKRLRQEAVEKQKQEIKQALINRYGVKFAKAIEEGKIIVGMTKQMVLEIRSDWTHRYKRTTANGVIEIWEASYPGKYYGPQVYVEGYFFKVEFINGKVTSISKGKG